MVMEIDGAAHVKISQDLGRFSPRDVNCGKARVANVNYPNIQI